MQKVLVFLHLEAMASGVPVIVSETTALPEVCGNAALYTDPYRPESIARAIDQLLDDSGFYSRQRIKGIQRANAFTWTNSAKAFMGSILNATKVR